MDLFNSMFSHSILLEAPGVALLFIIAWLTHLTHKGSHTASSITIVSAFLLTAWEDTTHAVLSFIDPTLLHDWVPFTWALSRTTLILMLITALFFQAYKVRRKIWGAIAAGVGVLFLIIPTVMPYLYPHVLEYLTFVQTDNFLKRPLELLPFALYGMTWLASCNQFSSQVILPSSIRWFLGVGALVHVPMAFGSHGFMDVWFAGGHILKIIEYGIWVWFAWFDYQVRMLTTHDTFMRGKSTCLRTYTRINIEQLNESVKNLNKLLGK